MPEDILPPNVEMLAVIQAVLTAGLGFSGDKFQAVLDRSDEFNIIAHESDLVSALKDDLDAFSVVVGISVALKEFATFDGSAVAGYVEQMQKAEDS